MQVPALQQNSWMLFNECSTSHDLHGPFNPVGPSFEINIFLEEGVQKYTSGVQLLIVKRADGGALLDQPTAIYDSSVFGSVVKGTTGSDLRLKLLTQKASKIASPDRPGNGFDVLTVFLEYSCQPHTRHTLIPFLASNSPNIGCQVIYNRFISVSDTSPGTIIRLTAIKPEVPTFHKPRHPITLYVLRILPTHGGRQLSLNLPPNIVEKIVGYALDHKKDSWATEIFNYALVQKGWVHLISLFWRRFTSIGSFSRPYIPNPLGLSTALAARPELKLLFSQYSDNMFSIFNDSPRSGGLSSTGPTLAEANSAIMRECSQVITEVYLVYLHSNNFDTITQALPSLEKVHLFDCALRNEGFCVSRRPNGQFLNRLWDLIDMISGWQYLENLRVTMSPEAVFEYHDREIPLVMLFCYYLLEPQTGALTQ